MLLSQEDTGNTGADERNIEWKETIKIICRSALCHAVYTL